MIRVFGALACLALAACSYSPVPITSTKGKQSDDRLLGQWQYTIEEAAEEKPETVSIEKADHGELIAHTSYEDGQPQESGDFRVVLARFGKERYASMTSATPGETIYGLIRYEFSDADHFVVYVPDLDQLKSAVDSKRIAGKWTEDRHMASIQLDTSAEELRAFVIANGTRIFSVRFVVFERLPTPRRP